MLYLPSEQINISSNHKKKKKKKIKLGLFVSYDVNFFPKLKTMRSYSKKDELC